MKRLSRTMYCLLHGKSPVIIDSSSGYPVPRCAYCAGPR